MTNLFPIFVKLAGRNCLVVGGGSIAEGKAEGLLACDATVVLVAPEVTDKIAGWARERRLVWHRREFQSSDLEDAFLVVAATGVSSLNESVFCEAGSRGVLCNVVDEPERCHFYYPAVVRRGSLQIAISTGGVSPALAQRLRIELEKQFGPEYAQWLQELGANRQAVFAKETNAQRRAHILRVLASRRSFQRFLRRERRRIGGSV